MVGPSTIPRFLLSSPTFIGTTREWLRRGLDWSSLRVGNAHLECWLPFFCLSRLLRDCQIGSFSFGLLGCSSFCCLRCWARSPCNHWTGEAACAPLIFFQKFHFSPPPLGNVVVRMFPDFWQLEGPNVYILQLTEYTVFFSLCQIILLHLSNKIYNENHSHFPLLFYLDLYNKVSLKNTYDTHTSNTSIHSHGTWAVYFPWNSRISLWKTPSDICR